MPAGYKSPTKPSAPIGIESEEVKSKKTSKYKNIHNHARSITDVSFIYYKRAPFMGPFFCQFLFYGDN